MGVEMEWVGRESNWDAANITFASTDKSMHTMPIGTATIERIVDDSILTEKNDFTPT